MHACQLIDFAVQYRSRQYRRWIVNKFAEFFLAVWLSGSIVGHINEDTLHGCGIICWLNFDSETYASTSLGDF